MVTCLYTYDSTLEGRGASTTGTIYGIYDTSGNCSQIVMGNYNNTVKDSGFPSFPAKRYYNKYTGSLGIKGDATNADGTQGFYNDISYFVYSNFPWVLHSAYVHYLGENYTGLFNFYVAQGFNMINTKDNTRFVLIKL